MSGPITIRSIDKVSFSSCGSLRAMSSRRGTERLVMFNVRLLSVFGCPSHSVSAAITSLTIPNFNQRPETISEDRVGKVVFMRLRKADLPVWVLEG